MNTPNNQSSLTSWIDWLLHLHAEEIDLGLDRISLVANAMQVTRPAPFVISVAGTNGKGSSVAMLAAIYKSAGYQVGTYTSPHIHSFVERVQINRRSVSEQTIVDAFCQIEASRKETKLTYFEFSTLAALTIFSQAELDVVFLEVGLGGRLDAVNVVDADAALITAIDIDHIEWLGDDRSQIAIEKAGIMRANKLAICSDPNPPQTLIDYASQLKTSLQLLNTNFSFSKKQNHQAWWFKNVLSGQESEFALPALKGEFQVQNAAGVVALVQAVNSTLPVDSQFINQGLQAVKHPGRLDCLTINDQAWLIDVAHNPQSAEVLAEYLSNDEVDKSERVAVFSALSDKDMKPMVKAILPFVSHWYIADLQIPRSSSSALLQSILLEAGVESENITLARSIDEAVKVTLSSDFSNVLAWGSFFTVAQVLQALEGLND